MTASFLLLFSLSSVVISEKREHMRLELVQVVWRHGDRSPTKTHRTDPIKEEDWKFGGGGFGQLSTIGMQQHFDFGKQIRKRYIINRKFLSEKYNAKEVYVRSSDYNRTIISAMANMMGMYSYENNASEKDVDYPGVKGWPQGLVPIPVHTVEHDSDYVAIAHIPCKRYNWLIEMLRNDSKQFQKLFNDKKVQKVFKLASEKAGADYNDRNIWQIYDVWKIEKVHFEERLNKCSWYDVKLYQKLEKINNRIINLDNGIFDKPVMMNGLDMGQEIKKLRGGSLANNINMHMHLKRDCLNSNESRCNWIKNLKYYVYSAHDTTVFALLSVLGIQSKVIYKGGYPEYTSAVFTELYTNTKDNNTYFKLLFRTSDVEDVIHTITHYIPECNGKDYCKLEVFQKYAEKAKPNRDMKEWCEVDPRRKYSKDDIRQARLKALIEKLRKELYSRSRRE